MIGGQGAGGLGGGGRGSGLVITQHHDDFFGQVVGSGLQTLYISY